MSLNLQKKKAIVSELKAVAENALSIVIADFCGITVDKMTKLRKEAREVGVRIRVIRNTLLRRAAEGTTFECLKSMFVGQTLVAFSIEHPGAAARLFKEFAKTNNAIFDIKGAVFKGKNVPLSQIDLLAALPTYKEAIVHLAMAMKESAVGKLIRTLTTVINEKKTAL